MPLYEYACLECDYQFETLVRNQDEEPECPNCESTRLERVMSVFARATTGGGGLDLPTAGCGGSGGFS